jgi:hypothetical protein
MISESRGFYDEEDEKEFLSEGDWEEMLMISAESQRLHCLQQRRRC